MSEGTAGVALEEGRAKVQREEGPVSAAKTQRERGRKR
jgi:hypothetical protein